MKRVIPVMIVSALLAAGCGSKKPATTQTTPNELQPMPPSTYTEPAPQGTTVVPSQTTVTPTPKAQTAKASKTTSTKQTVSKSSATPKTSAAAKATGKTYTVKKGDTLAVVAKAHKTTIKKIKAVNPGLNPDRIYVGQKLKMP